MVLGQIVELCVSVVTIVNYCAQCELLIFYLREIGLRMEEKTKDLNIIMKVIILFCFCNLNPHQTLPVCMLSAVVIY